MSKTTMTPEKLKTYATDELEMMCNLAMGKENFDLVDMIEDELSNRLN